MEVAGTCREFKVRYNISRIFICKYGRYVSFLLNFMLKKHQLVRRVLRFFTNLAEKNFHITKLFISD